MLNNNYRFGINYYEPTSGLATMPWSRYSNPIIDLSGSGITYDDMKMRRKAEVLQYKRNSNQLTKNQKWTMINKGSMQKKKAWASQGSQSTNSNSRNLPFVPNSSTTLLYTTTDCSYNSTANIKISTTASDVPGKPMDLYLDPEVPLTNMVVKRTYLSGGTKWPESGWMPGDDGFPVGKSGNFPQN
jgi:hypothetical protein